MFEGYCDCEERDRKWRNVQCRETRIRNVWKIREQECNEEKE